MGKRYAFDIETDGLLPELTTIHSLVLKDLDSGEVTSCVGPLTEGLAVDGYCSVTHGLALMSTADELVGHNVIKFDIPAIQKVHPEWVTTAKAIDTMVLGRLLWPDIKTTDFDNVRKKKFKGFPAQQAGKHTLEAYGYRLGKWKGDYAAEREAEAKAQGITDPAAVTRFVWGTWNPEMQDYCEQDVEVTTDLYASQLRRISRLGWSQSSIDLEHRVLEIIARQERRGFRFNVSKAAKLYSVLMKRHGELHDELIQTFKPWFMPHGKDRGHFVPKADNKRYGYAKGAAFTKVKLTEFNPASRHHISNRLKTLFGWEPTEFGKDGHPTVDDEILGQLPWPEAKLLAEFLMVEKRIGQLATGKQAWLKHEKDGFIHGGVNTLGTVTGRMSHLLPNIGQVPKRVKPYGAQCRELFEARLGYVLVGCDADALELRTLAGYMAKYDGGAYIDTVLAGRKEDGTDMHSVNCRAIGLDPVATYDIDGSQLPGREIAKTWFYAFIYGAGDYKLGSILGVRGEKKDIVAAGKRSRAKVLNGLPALGKLVKLVKEAGQKRGGVLKALDGRFTPIRGYHAALNTLLQGAGAILMKRALVILDDSLQANGFRPGDHYEFVANVHDEWQIEVRPDIAEDIGMMAAQSIAEAGTYYNFGCPLAGNYDIGSNWAETH